MTEHQENSKTFISKNKKFIQICGMLSSEFDGERASAAKAASSLLKEAGMTWAELLSMLVDDDTSEGAPRVKGRERNGIQAYAVVKACAAKSDDCESDWDEDFIANLNQLSRRYGRNTLLSEKQWTHVWRIAESIGVIVNGRLVA